ncbi:MAG: amidohydrolase family protein, partial [Gammaproteobacteria bacterium]|nr:amidohydrolase family protein [Gammaproteobacteria bacterium]
MNLIDGTGRDIQPAVDIGIRGGTIAEIGKTLQWNNAAEVIDGHGRFVIPGLIDAHVHLDTAVLAQLTEAERTEVIRHNPYAFLYNGVTTVLNVSSEDEWIWELREAQRTGELIAPRIYAMGSMFSPKDGWGYAAGLPDAHSAEEKARHYVSMKTDGFKIILEDGLGRSGRFTEMPDDMLNAITAVGRQHDIPVYIHAINIEEYERAVAVEPKAIVHGLEDPIPENSDLPAKLKQENIYIVPTLSLFKSFVTHDGSLDSDILRNSIPGFMLDYVKDEKYMENERRLLNSYTQIDSYEWVEKKLPVFMNNTTLMHHAGIKLAAGTDAGGTVGYNFQGYNTPWELKLFVECGLTPMEAIVAGTGNGAEVIGAENILGT